MPAHTWEYSLTRCTEATSCVPLSCFPEARANSNPSSSSSVDFGSVEIFTYSFDGTPTRHTPFVLPRLATGSFEPLDLRVFRNFRFVPEKLAQKNPSDPAIQRSSGLTIQRSKHTRLRPETFVCPRVLSLALSYSHSRTESWCLRRRAKPDLLALLAQSQASRGLAPEALSAQLAVSTCSLKLSQSLASRGLAPEALSSQLSVSTCSLKLVQSLASRGLAPEAFADQLLDKVGAVTCIARPCVRFFVFPTHVLTPGQRRCQTPPGLRRYQTPPDRRRCKMCKLFLSFGGGGPVSTRHSFCQVSLSRTSHRP